MMCGKDIVSVPTGRIGGYEAAGGNHDSPPVVEGVLVDGVSYCRVPFIDPRAHQHATEDRQSGLGTGKGGTVFNGTIASDSV